MKTFSEKKNRFLTKFSPKRLDKRLYVFLICLAFSSLFWLLTVLSKEYTSQVVFNACFINLPADKILIKDLPTSVRVRVKATGFTLLNVQYSAQNDTLFIDASNVRKYLSNNENSSNEVYFLLLNNQLNLMADQLGGRIVVERIMPDTVTFLFDQKTQKIVPVKLNLNYTFAKQYQQGGKIKIIPSNIVVKGPKSLLDKIDYLETEIQEIAGIEATKKHVIPLKENTETSIDYGISSVIAEIPAEKYTEAEIELPIKVENIPFGYVVKTFPSKVKVKYHVSLQNYESIKPDQFRLVANMNNVDDIIKNRIKIELVEFPPSVSNTRIETPQVEFIIRKL